MRLVAIQEKVVTSNIKGCQIVEELSSEDELKDFEDGDNDRRRRQENPYNFCIKIDLPWFNGHLFVESFLDWLLKVGNCFYYIQGFEAHQVKSISYKLRGDASTWWEQT
jgi:hypothetical protein